AGLILKALQACLEGFLLFVDSISLIRSREGFPVLAQFPSKRALSCSRSLRWARRMAAARNGARCALGGGFPSGHILASSVDQDFGADVDSHAFPAGLGYRVLVLASTDTLGP